MSGFPPLNSRQRSIGIANAVMSLSDVRNPFFPVIREFPSPSHASVSKFRVSHQTNGARSRRRKSQIFNSSDASQGFVTEFAVSIRCNFQLDEHHCQDIEFKLHNPGASRHLLWPLNCT